MMIGRIKKIQRFMKEGKTISEISKIISSHFEISADDDKVLDCAEEIYISLFGKRTYIDP